MSRIYLIGWLLFFLVHASASAVKAGGERKKDAGLWIYAGVTPKWPRGKWQTTYALEYRSREYLRATSLWCVSANVGYVFNRFVQVGSGYEFFLNRTADGRYTPEYRYYPEVIFSCRSGSFSAGLRSRLMNTFTRVDDPLWEGRNRLKLCYAIAGTGWKPFVAVEPYHELYPGVRRLRKIRYAAGCSFRLCSRRQVDVYYMRENYLPTPFTRHVMEIDYNYAF
jgi:hypothetical protein